MRHFLTYAGKDSTDFGIYISGAGTFDAPERDTKSISIPGRNGDLTLDNGRYKNIRVEYPIGYARNFKINAEAIRNFFLSFTGYQRLEDTYHPDEYRMAKYTGGFDSGSTKGMSAGITKLAFDCMPQRFLKEGERQITLSARGTIYNPTGMTAKPLLYVTGRGTLTINEVRLTIGTSPMYIDCEIQEAYSTQGTSLNSQLTLNDGVFPSLKPGDNSIVPTGSIVITPRWWKL